MSDPVAASTPTALAATGPSTRLAAPSFKNWEDFKAWMTSSTTILGNAGVFATIAACIGGQITWKGSVPAFIGEAFLIICPQLSSATRQELVSDVLTIVSALTKK